MAKRIKHFYEFGPFRLDTSERLLLRGDRVVPLTPKVFDVLLVLVQNSGHILEKDEVLKAVWPDTIVEEANLARNISTLRKALGESADEHQYIETIPWRGYRFVANVKELRDPGVEAPIPFVEAKVQERPRTIVQPMTSRLRWVVLTAVLAAAGAFMVYRLRPELPLPPARIIPFTSFPNYETEPVFSPDGNQLAFVYSGETGDNLDIYVKLVDVGTPLRLTNHPASDVSPAWSPDGRFIAFVRARNEERTIVRVPSLGGAEQKLQSLTTGILHLGMDFSPDGRHLAFVDQETPKGPHSIFLLSLDTLERRKLTSPPHNSFGDLRPAFSPDGATLAFVRYTTYNRDIYRVPVEGGEPVRITFDNQEIEGFSWTPDGTAIIFSSNRTGRQSLWKIGATGGVATRVEVAGEGCVFPCLSRRGNRLAYMQALDDANIWRSEVPTSAQITAPSKLISSTQFEGNPQYSPNGDKIAFESDRSGNPEIWLSNSDGLNHVQVTSLGHPYAGNPRWSPDGTRIVFDSRVEGHRDLFGMDVEEGAPRRLTSEPSTETWPSWSRDGRSIYFASDRTGSWEVWRMPSDGGQAVQITSTGGFVAFESFDGKLVYYSKFDKPGLYSVPSEGGEETPVLESLGLGDWGRWALSRKAVYLFNFNHNEPEAGPSIDFFSLATRKTSKVVSLNKNMAYRPGLTVSPDDRWVLYTQVDYRRRDIWVVENFR